MIITTYTKRPTVFAQTSGSYSSSKKYRTFRNTANMYDSNTSTYSYSDGYFGSGAGTWNRPSTLIFRDFKFSIPEHEEITNIKIVVKHQITAQNGSTSVALPNIPAPTISLLNTPVTKTGKIAKPTGTATENSINFTFNLDKAYAMHKSFGFKLDYPANISANTGYLRIYDVYITITTKPSSYTVSLSRISSDDCKVDETVSIKFTVKNDNSTNYNPQLLIQLPSSYLEYDSKVSGDGNVTISEGNLYWNSGLTSSSASKTITCKFKCLQKTNPNCTITFKESKYNLSNTSSLSLEIIDNTMIVSYEDLLNNITEGEDYIINLTASCNSLLTELKDCDISISGCTYDSITASNSNVIINNNTIIWTPLLNEELEEDMTLTITNIDSADNNHSFTITIHTEDEGNLLIKKVNIIPTDVGEPFYTCLQLGEEELNRMGPGYSYVIGSLMKINYDGNTPLSDFGTNFRLGVYHDDPSIIFYDKCSTNEKASNYISQNVTISYKSTYMNINHINTSNGTYFYNHDFTNTDTFRFKFVIRENNNTNVNSSYVVIGDKEYPLSYFNIDFTDKTAHSIEMIWDKDENNIYTLEVLKNNELYCTDDGITFNNNTKLGFKIKNSDISIESIGLYEADEGAIYSNLYRNAYTNCNNWSEWIDTPNQVYKITTEPIEYNEKYPIVIIFTGECINMTSGEESLSFSSPFVVENETEAASTESAPVNGNYPTPIRNLITDEATINFNKNSTEEVVFYDFENFDIINGEDIGITGISISFEISGFNELDVMGYIRTDINGIYSNAGRSKTVVSNSDGNTYVELGGPYDNFGIDFINEFKPKNFEVGLKFSSKEETIVTISNIEINVYYNKINNDKVYCIVDEVDLRYYGFIIESLKVPFGIDTDTKYLTIGGSDVNQALRMNITEKEIEIKFRVEDCDILSSTRNMEEITKIFTNKRNTMNKPIPKQIRFSHFPNVYWNFINERAIDAEAEFVDYEGTIKLTVPDGTNFSIIPESTVNMGKVNGLARVKPIITVNNLTTEVIVTELRTKKVFRCTSNTFSSNDELEINCSDRTLYHKITPDGIITNLYYNNANGKLYTNSGLTTEVASTYRKPNYLLVVEHGENTGTYRYMNSTVKYQKITDKTFDETFVQEKIPILFNEAVDWSSDWFAIDDEYNFTGISNNTITCEVINVTYYERG